MIRCSRYRNAKCLKCGSVPVKLIKIGAFLMCDACYLSEFGRKMAFIDPRSTKGEKYYKWLKKYNKSTNP